MCPFRNAIRAGCRGWLCSLAFFRPHRPPRRSEGLLEPEHTEQCLVVKSWTFWSWGQAEPAGSHYALRPRTRGRMTNVSPSLRLFVSLLFGGWPAASQMLPQSPYPSYPAGFSTNPGAGRAEARGWGVFGDPPHSGDAYGRRGVASAAVPRGARTRVARGGRQEDDPTAAARFARRCRGSFGRRGLSRAWGLSKSHPTREARLLGAPGRALALAEGAHEASPESPAEEVAPRRGLPGEECRAAGCDDSRPHTSRKCRERNQVEGANKAGAPGGRRSAARDLPSG